jgi:hypothetical protein
VAEVNAVLFRITGSEVDLAEKALSGDDKKLTHITPQFAQ